MFSVTSYNVTSAAAADRGLLNDDTTLTSTSVMNTNAERFMALSTMRARPKRADFLLRRGHVRSEEHTSELQSRFDLVCRLLLEKKKDKSSSDEQSVTTSNNIR